TIERDEVAKFRGILEEAPVHHRLRTDLADRPVYLDFVPVDGERQAGEGLRLEHGAEGEGVGFLWADVRIAARETGDVERLHSGRAGVVDRGRAAGLVETLGQVRGPHVPRVGAAQPDHVRN